MFHFVLVHHSDIHSSLSNTFMMHVMQFIRFTRREMSNYVKIKNIISRYVLQAICQNMTVRIHSVERHDLKSNSLSNHFCIVSYFFLYKRFSTLNFTHFSCLIEYLKMKQGLVVLGRTNCIPIPINKV